MADQKRWFKLWCSAPSDDDLQYLTPDLRWAWAAFGCYTKLHGTRGRVTVNPTNAVLAAEMGVAVEQLFPTIKRLPHMRVEEGISDNGTIAVTWGNWSKYQEDSTVSERVTRLRSKRRREENKNKKREEPPLLIPPDAERPIPQSIQTALRSTQLLNAAPRLWTLEFWRANIRATSGHVDYAQEILKAEAWLTANPTRAPRKDLARFLHNWLSRAGERL